MSDGNLNNGSLVISLDFELLWGVFDKVDFKEKIDYFENTTRLIPDLLKLFDDNKIHVTWATVGMLFNENWDEWMKNIPEVKPDYENSDLSPYLYAYKNKEFINENLTFASSIIDKIIETRNQEIGTHTYSHYYCLEPGQSCRTFLEDLKTSKKLAEKKNIVLESLVFPRNQFNPEYSEICKELGINTIRTNPDNWYWQNTQKDSFIDKIFRTGDAYIGKQDKSYSLDSFSKDSVYPIQQKASRLLRPRESKLRNHLKLRRVYEEITYAAKNKEIYHLWWHPHNFGYNPSENLEDLKLIIEHFRSCQEKYGMQSLNMAEVTKIVRTGSII